MFAVLESIEIKDGAMHGVLAGEKQEREELEKIREQEKIGRIKEQKKLGRIKEQEEQRIVEEEILKTAGISGDDASNKRLFCDMDVYKNTKTRDLIKMLNGDDFVDVALIYKVLKVRGYITKNEKGKIRLRKL